VIAIVDYGMGNVRSVERALAAVGGRAQITSNRDEITQADRIVLPGVGAFGTAMDRLRDAGLDRLLTELVVERGVPFLGICLGMQLICRDSTEHGQHEGLGWIDAPVRRIEPGDERLRIPHIGWNDVAPVGEARLLDAPGVFYFVHSFCVPADSPDVVATCRYGAPFAACLERGNIWAAQFHPEKSQTCGLDLLKRFIVLEPATAAAA
jgi:glutamine amidotransferase